MKSKKLQKYQNSGSTGYSWSQGQTNGNALVPATRPGELKETQKDINKRQEQINKLANDVLKSKSLEDLTDEDYSIIEQSTIPKKDNITRDYRILKANRAQQQDNAWTAEVIANSTAALGDKLSLQRLPGIGQYIPDVLDVTKGLGDMAAGFGAIPDNLNKGQYSQAALNLGLPLLTGALGGLGTTTRGQFLNNLVNPLAGLKTNFKSEINWGKWNKEIPNNKSLMQEYNAIEQQAKANGTWMKNPDGSKFQGTPEQFVQQNSSNFKKAFPEGSENVFRGTGQNIAELRPNRSTFTANQELASGYAPFNKKSNFLNSESVEGGVHSFYRKNSKNSLELDANNTSWTSVDLSNRRLTKDYFERNIKSQEDQITKQKEYLSKMKQKPNGSWEAPDGTTYSNDLYKNTVGERELYLKDLKER